MTRAPAGGWLTQESGSDVSHRDAGIFGGVRTPAECWSWPGLGWQVQPVASVRDTEAQSHTEPSEGGACSLCGCPQVRLPCPRRPDAARGMAASPSLSGQGGTAGGWEEGGGPRARPDRGLQPGPGAGPRVRALRSPRRPGLRLPRRAAPPPVPTCPLPARPLPSPFVSLPCIRALRFQVSDLTWQEDARPQDSPSRDPRGQAGAGGRARGVPSPSAAGRAGPRQAGRICASDAR